MMTATTVVYHFTTMAYRVYKLDSSGEKVYLTDAVSLEKAEKVADFTGETYPHAYVDIEEEEDL